MLDALARLIHRRRGRVLALAAAFALVAGAVGGPVVGLLKSDRDFEDPASQSVVARERIARATGALVAPWVVALVHTAGPVTAPAGRARVAAVVRAMRAARDVARVDSLLSAPRAAFVSRDGRASYV